MDAVMLGESRPMVELRRLMAKVAGTKLPVMIVGESGTGKELVAGEIHRLSGRTGAFVAVNCAQFPASLADGEFFGHVKGAFTGADAARPGAFVEAEHGTLFLDEIGELALETQAKLLRALQNGRFRPVGGRGERQVDVRVLCATHRDLCETVARGEFREDLYFRLAGFELRVPALRDRDDDLILLARHFAKELGKPLAPSAIHALQQYTWPGNVRELKSSVESAFVVAEGAAIDAADIRPRRIRPRSQSSSSTVQLEGKSLKEILREVFVHALRSSDGTIRGAALCLGLSKSKFYRNARELGVPFGGIAPQRAVKL